MDLNIEKILKKQEEDNAKPAKIIDTLKINIIVGIVMAALGFVFGKIGF